MKKSLLTFLTPWIVTISLCDWSMAHPPNAILHGNSCATCHARAPDDGGLQGGGEERPDAMSVVSDLYLDPDESVGTPPEDWTDRGRLKLFTAKPGETIDLTMHVQRGATEYAIQLKRLEKEGFAGQGNVLVDHVTPDTDWVPQGFDERTYYTHSTDDFDGHDWLAGSTTPVPYAFSITLGPDTPLDVYDLEFATAGVDAATAFGKWYGDEHFYLQVVPEPQIDSFMGMISFGLCLWGRRRRGRPGMSHP